jgi:hypothetical protein
MKCSVLIFLWASLFISGCSDYDPIKNPLKIQVSNTDGNGTIKQDHDLLFLTLCRDRLSGIADNVVGTGLLIVRDENKLVDLFNEYDLLKIELERCLNSEDYLAVEQVLTELKTVLLGMQKILNSQATLTFRELREIDSLIAVMTIVIEEL